MYAKVELDFPTPPALPTLQAIAGDKQINLFWNTVAEDSTDESFLNRGNDFQGYKLYRSRDPEMKDAEMIPGSWDNTTFKEPPLLVCDKIDGIYGQY